MIKTITPADKTSNLYRLDKEEYKHLFANAITSTYKRARKDARKRINRGGIKYTKNANLLDRIEVIGKGNYFTTLKDHKSNFINHLTK